MKHGSKWALKAGFFFLAILTLSPLGCAKANSSGTVTTTGTGTGTTESSNSGCPYAGGDGSHGNPYQIATVCQLETFSEDTSNWTKNFVLTTDIDLAGVSFEPVIDNFSGLFDGAGFAIKNWTTHTVLFKYSNGTIQNLTLHNITVAFTEISRGGLLTGTNDLSGLIQNCAVSGTFIPSMGQSAMIGGVAGINHGSIVKSNANWVVSAEDAIGGLVGYNEGSISLSYATGSVTGSGSYLDYGVGGLAGVNSGSISNSYSTATVHGDAVAGGLVGQNTHSIDASYSTGAVSAAAGASIGGLVGQSGGGGTSVTNSYWDTQTSGQVASPSGTGENTAAMQTQATFASWNFATLWAMSPGSYPSLR